jgi:uncharacterized membrane protein
VLHLFHPALVHFSVALLVAGSVSEVWGILGRREGAERFGATLVLIGTVSLLPTIVTGLLAKNSIVVPAGGVDDLELHERLGFVLAAVFLLSQFLKAWRGGRLSTTERKVYVIILLVGVAMVIASAVIGAELVYEHGLGVAAP